VISGAKHTPPRYILVHYEVVMIIIYDKITVRCEEEISFKIERKPGEGEKTDFELFENEFQREYRLIYEAQKLEK
jgi:hypothetical protein